MEIARDSLVDIGIMCIASTDGIVASIDGIVASTDGIVASIDGTMG